jgi:hypothetical protein
MGDDSVTVEVGPAGVKAALSGFDTQHIFLSILIIACSGLIWWGNEKHELESSRRYQAEMELFGLIVKNQAKILEATLTHTKSTVEAIQDAAEVQAYVLTLSQAQREALKLTMPHSLKMRGKRDM